MTQKITKKAEKTVKKVVKKIKDMKKVDLANLHDLLMVQMKDLYDTEHQIAQGLPKVIKSITDKDLKELVEHHLKETKDQIVRLEEAYASMDMKPKRQKSMGMKGLLDDGKEIMGMKANPEIMDAAITCNSQHIEHQEIAGYKGTIEWAKLLKLPKVVAALEKNLEQEIKMEEKLTALATKSLNNKAAALSVTE